MSNLDLSSKVQLIENYAKRFPSQDMRDIASRAKGAFQHYSNELASGNSASAEGFKTEIIQLEHESLPLIVKHLSQKGDGSQNWNWRSGLGVGALILVFIGILWFTYAYAEDVGYDKFLTIEGTRPLLVVAAIISTIVFGGSLLIGSLFSSDGPFEERFRHAREVFLVFSGIFGTVIGFYFGASDSIKPKSEPVESVQEGKAAADLTSRALLYEIPEKYRIQNGVR